MATIEARPMKWMTLEEMSAAVPLPDGYRFERLRRSDIAEVVTLIGAWFPGIRIGSASDYTRAEFFETDVTLDAERETDVSVVLIRRNLELAAIVCCERDRDALTVYGTLIVVAPAHRGAQLGGTGALLLEAQARHMGAGLVYGMATLKFPHMQRALEAAGWQLINGQQLKCLTVIDEFTRECLAIDVAGSIRSGRVIEVLSRLVTVHGAPKYLRSDNGPEFVSRAVLRWLSQAQIDTACIDPGKPWQNGSNESFNGKLRDECLGMQWFKNRIDAKILIEEFRREFNEVRPHSSLGQLTPAEFKQALSTTTPERAIS